MSFGHNEGGDLKYASVISGKFASKLASAEEAFSEVVRDDNGNIDLVKSTLKPNHRARLNKNNILVGEFVFDSASGTIDRFETRDSEFGTQISLSLRFDNGTIVVISTNALNENGETLTSIAASIGDQIGLVDFNQPLKIGLTRKDGKVRGISFEQGGVYIPNSKDNKAFADHIAKRPQPVEKQGLKGKFWDWSAPSAWQWEQINNALERFVVDRTGGDDSPGGQSSGTYVDTFTDYSEENIGSVPDIDATPF